MKRKQFLNELKKELHGFPPDESENILNFYKEYLDEAENVEGTISMLPHPAKIVSDLRKDCENMPITNDNENGKTLNYLRRERGNRLELSQKKAIQTQVIFLSVLLTVYCTYINYSAVYLGTNHFFDKEIGVFVIPDMSVFYILFTATFAFLGYSVFVKKTPIIQGKGMKHLLLLNVFLLALMYPLTVVTGFFIDILQDNITIYRPIHLYLSDSALFLYYQAELFLCSTVVLGFFVMLLTFAVIPFHFFMGYLNKMRNRYKKTKEIIAF